MIKKIQKQNLLISAPNIRQDRNIFLFKSRIAKLANSLKLNQKIIAPKKQLPKIVGDIRHYPPANKEWKNSAYAYNKDTLRSSAALDKVANRTIRSYFNLTNNRKLARSYRMRNLIRRSTSKRVYTSKPEIKQTSSNVNITVYVYNREGQSIFRKLYFYNKSMNMNRDIFLHKIWLKKNMLAFRKTFKQKNIFTGKTLKNLKQIRSYKNNKKFSTLRRNINKTYIHNILMKRYLKRNKSLAKNINIDLSEQSPRLSLNKPANSVVKLSSLRRSRNRYLKWNSFITKNIFRSLIRRNLIRKLKTQVKKTSKTLAAYSIMNRNQKPISLKNTNIVRKGMEVNSALFQNYILEKGSRKLNYKLRNYNSVMKIRKNLSMFYNVGGRRKKARFKKIRLPYSNFKFKKEIKFFSFKLLSDLKYIRKLFMFYFIKYMFSLLEIKIQRIQNLQANSVNNVKAKNGKTSLLAKIFTGSSLALNNIRYGFNTGDREQAKISYFIKKKKDSRKAKNRIKKIIKLKFKNRYSYNKLRKIDLLNLELLNFLKLIISMIPNKLNDKRNQFTDKRKAFLSNIFNKNNINSLYVKFERKYFLKFLGKYFKKEFLYINYYSKFLLNKLKFGKFLPGLKYLVNKIYSKKVKLNIVNLKYPHLNSDIYADMIASKLKKKLSLWKVLRRSISMAKLPFDYLPYDRWANLNKLPTLTTENRLNVFDLASNYLKKNKKQKRAKNIVETDQENTLRKDAFSGDLLDLVLNKLYPISYLNNDNNLLRTVKITKANNSNKLFNSGEKSVISNKLAEQTNIGAKNLKILNMIRYKWVSGVRLEAAGRLTRRYTAARSVFKFKYKGSLKNIDYSQKADTSKKNMSTVMLRNYAKANSQYTFTKSKRRIGAFGLKAWIASY